MTELYYCSDLPNEVIDIIKNMIIKIEEQNKFEEAYRKHFINTFPEFIVKNVSIDIVDYVKSKWSTFNDFLKANIPFEENNNIVSYVCQKYMEKIPDKYNLYEDDILKALKDYISNTKIKTRHICFTKEIKSIILIYDIIGKQYSLDTAEIIEQLDNYTSKYFELTFSN